MRANMGFVLPHIGLGNGKLPPPPKKVSRVQTMKLHALCADIRNADCAQYGRGVGDVICAYVT